MSGDADTFAIQLLIDELKNDDTVLRLNSVNRLTTIARALGAERTRDELVPFLNESLDDEDEVLLAMAGELGKLVPLVGGGEHARCLLAPLEQLAAVEETLVRDKAVESLSLVVDALPHGGNRCEQLLVPLVARLAGGEWFTSRTSACGLFAVTYRKVNAAPTSALPKDKADEARRTLRKLFAELCADTTPMVRRAAARNLGKLALECGKADLKRDVMPLFERLAADDQDSVRLLAVENCVAIATVLGAGGAGDITEHVWPVIAACAGDKSWRVRYMVADLFCRLCEAVGAELTAKDMVPAFIKLVKDNEAEVRTAAAGKVDGICKLVPAEDAVARILPCIKELVTDQSQHVRAALAGVIMGVAPTFGKERTIEHLQGLYLQLLKDDFPDVRLNIISRIDAVNKVVGIDSLSKSLLPAIVELAEDKNWRVRLAIINYIPLLAEQLGVDFFNDQLSNLCMTWLGDSVFAIREAAAKNLTKLAAVFGKEWTKANIVPKILMLYTHPNYLYRMTTLFCIAGLAEASGVSTDVFANSLMPLIHKLCTDPVPNVRVNVAKALDAVGQAHVDDKAFLDKLVRPNIDILLKDTDQDVKFLAGEALAHIENGKASGGAAGASK